MSVLSESQATRLKLINQYLAKADGKDKLCATIQVRCIDAFFQENAIGIANLVHWI
eukprot:jgi/Pico_ML_1/55561/g1230.t1